jgi:AcrR family transcriptional regulator
LEAEQRLEALQAKLEGEFAGDRGVQPARRRRKRPAREGETGPGAPTSRPAVAGGLAPVRGRPRDPRAYRAIVDATTALLAEVGYAALTMEGVAARAGVAKTTVYRRWRSKAALVVDVMGNLLDLHPFPDTGSTRDDFLLGLRRLIASFSGTVAGQVFASLLADLVHDPELAASFRQEYLRPQWASIHQALERGAARGDLRADLDRDLVVDELVGPVYYHLLVRGEPLGEDSAGPLVDFVLQSISRSEPRSGSATSPHVA